MNQVLPPLSASRRRILRTLVTIQIVAFVVAIAGVAVLMYADPAAGTVLLLLGFLGSAASIVAATPALMRSLRDVDKPRAGR